MSETRRLEAGNDICFLLGAGASMPAGIPNVVQFVDAFHEDLVRRRGDQDDLPLYLEALRTSWKKISQEDDAFPSDLGLERLYELLTYLSGQPQAEVTIPLRLHHRLPGPCREAELLAWELKKYVQKRCLGFDRRKLRYLRPLLDFVSSESGLDILTLNYDTTIEDILQAGRVPWSDGFPEDESVVDFFSPEQFLERSCAGSVRLLKLHGSASWYWGAEGIRRLLVRSQRSAALRFGQARSMTHEAMMIYPTLHKALTRGPFPALILAAQEVLRTAKLLIVSGYGFGDRHVRRLVIEALLQNKDLRLVLVDPWAEGPAELLFREARMDDNLRTRIGVCGFESSADRALPFGFIDRALKGGWLLERVRTWLQGADLDSPVERVQHALRKRGWKWDLRYPLKGGAAYLALSHDPKSTTLWTLTGKRRRLLKMKLGSSHAKALPLELTKPRGMVWDSETRQLYLVDNAYLARHSFLGQKALSGKTGLGRIWALDSEGRVVRALTKVNPAVALPRLMQARMRDQGLAESLGHGTGILAWPNSVLLERPGVSLLATEARRLTRLDLKTGKLSYPVEIPLCFNLCGLAKGPDETVLLVDAGVHPTGRGRLMRADLSTGSIEILAIGETRFDSVLWHAPSQLILVSVGWGWPRGRVLAFRLSGAEAQLTNSWEGLDRPGFLIEANQSEVILVATAKGIVELTVGDRVT